MTEAHKPDLRTLHAQFVDAARGCANFLDRVSAGDASNVSLWLVEVRERVTGLIQMSDITLGKQVHQIQHPNLKQHLDAGALKAAPVERLKQEYKAKIASKVTVQPESRDAWRVEEIVTPLAKQTHALEQWMHALAGMLAEQELEFEVGEPPGTKDRGEPKPHS